MRRTLMVGLTALILTSVACEGIVAPAADRDRASFARSAQGFSWTPAVSVDLGGVGQVNTAAVEGCPNESADGQSLYFATNRDGGLDIWVAHRDSHGDWGDPEKLPAPVNTIANEFCPTSLPDGGLLFVSTRVEGNCGAGTSDIYETSYLPNRGWSDPVPLGCTVNSSGNEFSPSFVAASGGQLFFSSDRSGLQAIYVSHRGPGGVWGTPAPVVELNLSGYNTVRPNVSQDGREIVFDSDRPGGLGSFDLWYARRSTPHGTWSTPENAGTAVNSTASETRGSLSRDGRRLYFGSTRSGFQGNSDLFVSHR